MRKAFALIVIFLSIVPGALGADPVHLERDGEKWAEKTLRKMSLEEKIGQLFMVWARVEFLNVDSPEYARLRDLMRTYHLGGFGVTIPVDGTFLFKNQPLEAAALLNRLQRDSELPLIFAADFERGLSMRLNGTTGFPHAMAFGATASKDYAAQFGRITAQEARAIGIHWNWFPVADVNSNPANPIINIRAFGEDPAQVSDLVNAYIAGARGDGMLTTVKHFPGHGDTDRDTHLATARVHGDVARLNSVELAPFRSAIEAGVDSVMVSHVTVPAFEPDPNRPATISHKIVTGLLKDQLGFRGIVVTDALDMAALRNLIPPPGHGQPCNGPALEALKAGNDVLIIPADLPYEYNCVLEAAKRGDVSREQIDASVLKVLRAKASVNLHKNRTVDLEEVMRLVSRPEHLEFAQLVADSAVTLLRDNRQVLPLRRNGTSGSPVAYQPSRQGSRLIAVYFTSDVRSEGGNVFERQLRLRVPDVRVIYIDESNAAAMAHEVWKAVSAAEKVIAVVDVIPTAGGVGRFEPRPAGSAELPAGPMDLLHRIVQNAGGKTVVVATGNPYVLSSIMNVKTYVCTFSDMPVSAVAAVKALFGEIPIRGKLPVTIPGFANRGAGIDLPAAR